MRYCLIARADIDACIHEVDKQAKCMPVVTTLQIYIFFSSKYKGVQDSKENLEISI